MVVRIDEREMRMRKRKKGGRVGPQCQKVERGNSKNSVFVQTGRVVGVTMRLVAWRLYRLKGAAVVIKATTMTSRNKNKFMVPDEIREVAELAAKCRDPVRRS